MAKTKQKTWKKIFNHGNILSTVFVWEIMEELLEGIIAMAFTNMFAFIVVQALSTLAVVSATQAIKSFIKKVIYPQVRKIIYKGGNDKMNKLVQFGKWLVANKCTLLGIGTGALVAVAGSGVIDVSSLPALVVGNFNVTPIIFWCLLGILTVLASFFPETFEKFMERVEKAKADKEAKAIVKEAEKELANEVKVANQTQAEKERKEAKTKADAQAKAEKEKALAEHRAKVNAVKARIIAEKRTEGN